MQLGNFLVIPIAAVAACGHPPVASCVSLLVGGLAAYLLAADVVRRLASARPTGEPARPMCTSCATHRRAVSGSCRDMLAVTTALAVIAWPYLSRRWRALP